MFSFQSNQESAHSPQFDDFTNIDFQSTSEDAFSMTNHPARMFHIRVSDLAKILEVTEEDNFLHDYICGNTKTSSSLEMIVNGTTTESIFTGKSKWLQAAFFNHNMNGANETEFVRNRFESMLRNNITTTIDKTQSAGSPQKNQLLLDGNNVSLHEFLQGCLNTSCMEWSKIELAIANSTSCELQSSLKENESKAFEFREIVKSSRAHLVEISRKAFNEMSEARVSISSKSFINVKRRRKRKVLSLITEENRTIRSMEEKLALEVERLSRTKRAKTILEDYLKLDSSLQTGCPFESVKTDWTNYLHFLLLDNDVDVVFILNDDNNAVVDTRCFFNEDDGLSMKLLKTLLLGTTSCLNQESFGEFPIRKSISSIIHARENFREQMIEAFQLLFRIENFAKCIRLLDNVFSCRIDSGDNGNVVLLVSANPEEGEMIQTSFSFENILAENWIFTTVPSDVKIEIVSTDEEFHEREKILTSKTRRMIASSIANDPFLLKKVCDFVLEN